MNTLKYQILLLLLLCCCYYYSRSIIPNLHLWYLKSLKIKVFFIKLSQTHLIAKPDLRWCEFFGRFFNSLLMCMSICLAVEILKFLIMGCRPKPHWECSLICVISRVFSKEWLTCVFIVIIITKSHKVITFFLYTAGKIWSGHSSIGKWCHL